MNQETKVFRRLLQFAFKKLSRRDYFSAELDQKLRTHPDWTEEEGAKVMAKLYELKLLDDDRRLDQVVSHSARLRGQGPRKIAQKIQAYGVDSKKVLKSWEAQEFNEIELAKSLLERNAFRWQGLPRDKQKARKIRFLVGRGFSPHLAFQLAEDKKSRYNEITQPKDQ